MEHPYGPPETGLSSREAKSQAAIDLASIIRDSADTVLSSQYRPDFESNERFDDKYGVLGEQLFVDFVQRAAATGDERLRARADQPATLHGCYLLGRLLRYGPQAYADYLSTQPDHRPSVSELADIMRRSPDVTKTFADRDEKDNTILETTFGLLRFSPAYDDAPPFVIAPNEHGELKFRASLIILERVALEVLRNRLNEGLPVERNPEDIHCPAIGIVMGSLWNQGISRCESDPLLFATDLTRRFPGIPVVD